MPGDQWPRDTGKGQGRPTAQPGRAQGSPGKVQESLLEIHFQKPKRIDVLNTTPSEWRELMINKYPQLPHQSPTIFFCFCKDNRVISLFFSFQFLSPNSASHFLLQRMFVVAGRCHPPATIKRTFMVSCGLLPLIPLNKLLSLQPRGSQSCSARRLAVVLYCTKKLI